MSIDESGLKNKVKCGEVRILIEAQHPLIRLSGLIDWERLKEIVLPDLKSSTAKGKWWLGRKLVLRIHLGAYILQQMYNLTDRQTEYGIKDNAAFQLCCGKGIVNKWHYPDHTKIEAFRSRLSPYTQNQLANEMAKLGVKLRYGDASSYDIDSTICEANMAYPTDINLLLRLGEAANKVWEYTKDKLTYFKDCFKWAVKIKEIRSLARRCYFDKEDKKDNLYKLWSLVCQEVSRVWETCRWIELKTLFKFPWNIQRALVQIHEHRIDYLSSIVKYMMLGKMRKGKALSLYLKEVRCFNKKKANQKLEFGRNIQLGRIRGNFLVVGNSTTVRMEDKHSVVPMINLHKELFGKGSLESITADKGYYSNNNEAALIEANIKEIGLQKPRYKQGLPSDMPEETRIRLINRRAGIEALIGHAKHGGQLGRSRMKSDRTMLSSAYTAVFGFNLRQLVRYSMGIIEAQAI